MCDRARPPNDVVPLASELLAKLDDVLDSYGYRLEDPSLGRAVMRMMVLIGKPAFRLVSTLERLGFRPDVRDRSVLQYGRHAAVAFGWAHLISRLGYERRRWVWLAPDGMMEHGDMYHDNPKLAALHDWMRLRRAGFITRITRH